jgi:RNA polymerase sigma-70 factor (ECF subfamily)
LDVTQGFLSGALGGSKEARGELLERLRPRLVLWTAARLSAGLRAKVEPEDIAQDILLAVHRDFGSFVGDDPRAFYRWFFTVAENRIRDIADHFGALKRQLPSPMTFSQTSPSTAAARSEEVARVMRAIEALPESFRQIVTLIRLEERSVAEAAEILGKTENAVRILYCRALKDLRSSLGTAP